MPSPETIKAKLTQLPVLSELQKPSRYMSDRETTVWERNEKGGHFHFYCIEAWLWNPKTGDNIPAIGYTLSVTGTDKSKAALAADFIAVLGEPKRNLRREMREAMVKKGIFRMGKNIAYFQWLQPKDKSIENDPSFAILAENYVEAFMMDMVPKDSGPTLPKHRNTLPPM
ncbi:hypothetical protein KKE03_03335 [Patescibacteria group bacterium]|nr:hypothetical protein [Patescibacteria group bacterium]